MGFGDLKSRSGLEALNKYLEDKSYIEGWVVDRLDGATGHSSGKTSLHYIVTTWIE